MIFDELRVLVYIRKCGEELDKALRVGNNEFNEKTFFKILLYFFIHNSIFHIFIEFIIHINYWKFII